jgi:transcriptional regulator with XRE-family HTH domain
MSIVFNMKTNDITDGAIICLVTSPDFREWLFKELEDRNWSQRDLAKKARISQGAISHVINGARQPGADFCQAIANAFGYPPETVVRVAGLLPPAGETDKDTEEMMHLFSQMTEDQQEQMIAMARYFVERRANRKPAGARPAEG